MWYLQNEEKPQAQDTNKSEAGPEPSNGNVHMDLTTSHVGHLTANFIQTEIAAEHKEMPKMDGSGDFTTHNGHNNLNHPLTLQNAI